MSGAFVTQTEHMQQAAGRVDEVNNDVRTKLGMLHGSVEAVQAYWTGQAASTFQTLMLRYDEDARRLSQALASIAEQIRTSGRAYAAQDQAAAQSMASAGSGLNL